MLSPYDVDLLASAARNLRGFIALRVPEEECVGNKDWQRAREITKEVEKCELYNDLDYSTISDEIEALLTKYSHLPDLTELENIEEVA
jgi:hypothetical protein